MLNLVQFHTGTVAYPDTGEQMAPIDVVMGYFQPFALEPFKRGGHPVFQARWVGGNIDSWNADDNLSFESVQIMRYSSRRDLAELVLVPGFTDGYVYKHVAIERTISHPAHFQMRMSLRPPSVVLLSLMLIASCLQIAGLWGRLRGSQVKRGDS